jgi:hypothetical protein
MTKKYRIASIDRYNNSALVDYFDDEVLVDGKPKVITLNLGIRNLPGEEDPEGMHRYLSTYFPSDQIYPSDKTHDYIESCIGKIYEHIPPVYVSEDESYTDIEKLIADIIDREKE